jgi:hypothetical protein
MVGIFFYNFLQTPAVCILLTFFVEVQQHCRPGNRPLRWLQVKPGLAIADPAPRLFFPSLAGSNFHCIGNHKRAIETHTKLPNQV